MSRQDAFAIAFYRQARADFETFGILSDNERVPHCHRLQFLQMACEKLSKAYLLRSRAADPEHLMRSHRQIAQALHLVAREVFRRFNWRRPGDRAPVMKRLTHLARQIELLSPAVDAGGRRPDNCEYPWEEADGTIIVPVAYSFPNVKMLYDDPVGVLLLRNILPLAFSDRFGFFD